MLSIKLISEHIVYEGNYMRALQCRDRRMKPELRGLQADRQTNRQLASILPPQHLHFAAFSSYSEVSQK
ncbi:hypothetical protein J6590_070356 [Homalodisca vitripennis]|nr:hypothetical protein J6590_070356 [Homalodisca vitripennis]